MASSVLKEFSGLEIVGGGATFSGLGGSGPLLPLADSLRCESP